MVKLLSDSLIKPCVVCGVKSGKPRSVAKKIKLVPKLFISRTLMKKMR